MQLPDPVYFGLRMNALLKVKGGSYVSQTFGSKPPPTFRKKNDFPENFGWHSSYWEHFWENIIEEKSLILI